MTVLKNLLVALDHTEMDGELVRLSAFIANTAGSKSVSFFHVVRFLNIPDQVLKEFPHLIDNALSDRKKEIEATVKDNFESKRVVQTEVVIERGQPTKNILKWSEKNDIDVIIIGRKKKHKGSGILSQRLARRASCSILIVPEESVHITKLKKLLVPIDFSRHSTLAVEQAINTAVNSSLDVSITCLNVYHVPIGYHYSGKSYEEFGETMKANAEKDYKRFIRKIDTKGIKVEALFVLDRHEKPVQVIYDSALKVHADGIIIGARGKTAPAAFLLGSISERLIQLDTKIPLLVVRPKGENAGIMEALKLI